MPAAIENDARIVYVTAGAGGMYCGSCLHDNALARALGQAGWDVQLVPTYTPIRTDEPDVSTDRLFFGGINVFLQQTLAPLRWVPRALDRVLDQPWLMRRATARGFKTDPRLLGALTVSMLKGTAGRQRKEVYRLVDWLNEQARPHLVVLSNLLIGGAVSEIQRQIGCPILVTLQGDDIFLDGLLPPYREQALELAMGIARRVDGFIVHSEFYRDVMSARLGVDAARFHVTPLGIDTTDFAKLRSRADAPSRDDHLVIGYLARIAPEKGLHLLVEAFIRLAALEGFRGLRLRVGGWLGPDHRDYWGGLLSRVEAAGLGDRLEFLGTVDRAQKLAMLESLDVLSVPTTYREPKGLYVLEALAAGVPVVVPRHGAFPEILADVGGGELVAPDRVDDLTRVLAELLCDPQRRRQLAATGRAAVLERRSAAAMAQTTGAVLQLYLDRNRSGT